MLHSDAYKLIEAKRIKRVLAAEFDVTQGRRIVAGR
jgi:hypothetical protein